MRTIILAFFGMFCLSSASAQELDCVKVKNGFFKLKDVNNGTTVLISRKGNIQTEEIVELGLKFSLEIVWLTECSYVLKKPVLLKGDPSFAMPENLVVTSEIISVSNKNYVVKTTTNLMKDEFKFDIEIQ